MTLPSLCGARPKSLGMILFSMSLIVPKSNGPDDQLSPSHKRYRTDTSENIVNFQRHFVKTATIGSALSEKTQRDISALLLGAILRLHSRAKIFLGDFGSWG